MVRVVEKELIRSAREGSLSHMVEIFKQWAKSPKLQILMDNIAKLPVFQVCHIQNTWLGSQYTSLVCQLIDC